MRHRTFWPPCLVRHRSPCCYPTILGNVQSNPVQPYQIRHARRTAEVLCYCASAIPIPVLYKAAICSDNDEARKAQAFKSVRLASPMVALKQLSPSVFPACRTGLPKIDGESALAEQRRQLPEDWFVLRLLDKHPHYSLITHHVHLKLVQGLDNLF